MDRFKVRSQTQPGDFIAGEINVADVVTGQLNRSIREFGSLPEASADLFGFAAD